MDRGFRSIVAGAVDSPGRRLCRFAPISVLLALPIWLEAAGAPQTITWISPATNSVLLLHEPTALQAGASSGLSVYFHVEKGPAVIEGNTVTATEVGTIILVAEQYGNAEFSAAPPNRLILNRSTVTFEPLAVWPQQPAGIAFAVKVVGNWVYVANGPRGLSILDVTDTAHPVVVGQKDCPGYAYGIEVDDDRAYVTCGDNGLQIIDVSDPTAPRLVGVYADSGFAWAVRTRGKLAYLVDAGYGLRILDVSDAAAPQLVGSCQTPGFAWGVQVSGDLAFLAGGDAGLQVVDVTSPANPIVIGSCRTPGYARNVHVVGAWAYVAENWGGLQVFDVSNPVAPVRIATFGTPNRALEVDVSGTIGFVADSVAGLLVVDLTVPAKPVLLGTYDTADQACDVQVSGKMAYVADNHGGLQIIDISNPTNPACAGSYESDLPGKPFGLETTGESVLISAGSAGFQIINIGNPAQPTRTGGYNTSGQVYQVRLLGDLAFVADGKAGLHVMDISDRARPHRIGGITNNLEAYALQVRDNLVYIASGGGVLHIVDVHDPANPAFLTSPIIGTSDDVAVAIELKENLAFVGSRYWGLIIYDVSDSARPLRLGTYRDGHYLAALQFSGELAYLLTDSEFQVLNVTNPAKPTRVGGYPNQGAWWPSASLCVNGELAFIANGYPGLKVLDITDSVNPVRVDDGTISGAVRKMQAHENLVLFGEPKGSEEDQRFQLDILKLREGLPQTIILDTPDTLTTPECPFLLRATAASGLPVTFSVVSGPGVINGNQLTPTGDGVVVVRATQSGNAQFLPVSVERAITVGAARIASTSARFTTPNQLEFHVQGPLTGQLAVLVSEDLIHWSELSVQSSSADTVIVDTTATNATRFYKVEVR